MFYKRTTFKGIAAHELSSKNLLVVLTDYGSKIQNIKYLNKEMLCQNTASSLYKISDYDSDFSKGEFSGFDEMFPNISAGEYPDGAYKGILLPDHGEVWSQSWRSIFELGALKFSIDGKRLPYSLTKKVVISGDSLILKYFLKNTGEHELKFIWAAHPLFKLEDNTLLKLVGATQIENAHGNQRYLGALGETHSWPVSNDGRDMQKLSPNNKCCNKYYVTNKLSENVSRIIYSDGVSITIKAPTRAVPYLGVWTDENGMDMSCVAPEPCTGAFDTIEKATEHNMISCVNPREAYEWQLKINFAAKKLN